MKAQENDQANKSTTNAQVEDRLRSMTMRLHQTEERLSAIDKKIGAGGGLTSNREAEDSIDVSYAVKI